MEGGREAGRDRWMYVWMDVSVYACFYDRHGLPILELYSEKQLKPCVAGVQDNLESCL